MTKKRFGIWTLSFLVIANMVGAGVFTTSGFTLADLGSPHTVVLAWFVGGLIAACGATGYGLLARLMPESGGEYLFLSRAAHPLLGFIAGWVSLIAGFSGAMAFAATALEAYLVPAELRPEWLPAGAIAVTAVILSALFHGFRPQLGAMLQNATVILKLGMLSVILAIAVSKLPTHTWHPEALAELPQRGWPWLAAFATAVVWISLSYSGFNAAVYVAGEAHDANRTVPRALILGTLCVAVLYVALNAVFVYAVPGARLAGQADVAAVAADWLGGIPLATFVRFTISAALLTSVLSMMMAAPRVYAKMADDGLLPSGLRLRDDSVWPPVLAQAVIAIALILFYATVRNLLGYLSLTLSLSAACSVACLFLPHIRRKFPWRMGHAFAAFYVAATLLAATILTISDPGQILGTAITFAAGAAMYFVARHFRRPRPTP